MDTLLAQARLLQGAALGAHILRCLRATGVFYFSELLSIPAVAALPECAVLQLFCFGTFADYRAAPAAFGAALTPALLKKLKLLSLASLGASARELSYADVRASLDLPADKDVEELVIEAIDAGLVEVRGGVARARGLRPCAQTTHSRDRPCTYSLPAGQARPAAVGRAHLGDVGPRRAEGGAARAR